MLFKLLIIILLFSGPFIGISQETIEKKSSLMVVHASVEYDKSRVAQSGLLQAIDLLKSKDATVISIYGNTPQYFDGSLSDVQIYSKDGDHRLVVRSINYFFAGGYFDACLQWAVNDVFENLGREWKTSLENKSINVYFITDAIFVMLHPNKTLEDILNKVQSLSSYLANEYGIINPIDEYNYFNLMSNTIVFDSSQFSFRVYRNGDLILKSGSGNKTVNVIFLKSSEIDGLGI